MQNSINLFSTAPNDHDLDRLARNNRILSKLVHLSTIPSTAYISEFPRRAAVAMVIRVRPLHDPLAFSLPTSRYQHIYPDYYNTPWHRQQAHQSSTSPHLPHPPPYNTPLLDATNLAAAASSITTTPPPTSHQLPPQPHLPQQFYFNQRFPSQDDPHPPINMAQWTRQHWVLTGDLEVMFIKRAFNPRDLWSGQIGYPGGRQAKGETDIQTSMREVEEEVGLHLNNPGQFKFITRLDDYNVQSMKDVQSLTVSTFVFLQLTPVTPTLFLEPKEVSQIIFVSLRLFGIGTTQADGHAIHKIRDYRAGGDGGNKQKLLAMQREQVAQNNNNNNNGNNNNDNNNNEQTNIKNNNNNNNDKMASTSFCNSLRHLYSLIFTSGLRKSFRYWLLPRYVITGRETIYIRNFSTHNPIDHTPVRIECVLSPDTFMDQYMWRDTVHYPSYYYCNVEQRGEQQQLENKKKLLAKQKQKKQRQDQDHEEEDDDGHNGFTPFEVLLCGEKRMGMDLLYNITDIPILPVKQFDHKTYFPRSLDNPAQSQTKHTLYIDHQLQFVHFDPTFYNNNNNNTNNNQNNNNNTINNNNNNDSNNQQQQQQPEKEQDLLQHLVQEYVNVDQLQNNEKAQIITPQPITATSSLSALTPAPPPSHPDQIKQQQQQQQPQQQKHMVTSNVKVEQQKPTPTKAQQLQQQHQQQLPLLLSLIPITFPCILLPGVGLRTTLPRHYNAKYHLKQQQEQQQQLEQQQLEQEPTPQNKAESKTTTPITYQAHQQLHQLPYYTSGTPITMLWGMTFQNASCLAKRLGSPFLYNLIEYDNQYRRYKLRLYFKYNEWYQWFWWKLQTPPKSGVVVAQATTPQKEKKGEEKNNNNSNNNNTNTSHNEKTKVAVVAKL